MHPPDDLLDYYRRELAYLREQGGDFAHRHPRVAKRLALGAAESADPHTERLIESFAFLTARVHRDIEREFPEVASALLENICPTLARTLPSMTVVRFRLDPSQGKLTSGLEVPRGSMLQALGSDGLPCRFRVAWDTTLWPLTLSKVTAEDSRILHIEISTSSGVELAELGMDSLRLHLAGDLMTTMPVHDLMLSGLHQVELVAADGTTHSLGPDSIRECGFDEGQEVLPLASHAHPAYLLLQEYFAFPRKFHFFDINGLRGRLGGGTRFRLRLTFNRSSSVFSRLNAGSFVLGCAPVVNLFAMTSEPIVVDRKRHEYLLIADRQREAGTEIYSVEQMTLTAPSAERPEIVPPALALGAELPLEAELRWTSRVQNTMRGDLVGTDTFVSFVDRAQPGATGSPPVIYAQVLCTNRRIAEQVPAGAKLVAESLSNSLQISALYSPSAQRDPLSLNHHALWALVSVLRLNHRSLVDGREAIESLKSLLLLFAGEGGAEQAQARSLRSLKSKPMVAQIGRDTWRGFCRGTEVEVEFDTQAFAGGSALLLSAVLARFFALYTTANNCVVLKLMKGGQAWKEWPPMAGRQILL